ncbi:MAG: radical SAM protein [Fibrobacteres bacterium]|nr:radical SAM protein [Fibrobacterota bacterium]
MNYPLFRPPAEADSLIIRAVQGCPHNSCAFCGMYKKTPFVERDFTDLQSEILQLRGKVSAYKRLFLADGDLMAISTGNLIKILECVNVNLPEIVRISIYANSVSVGNKSSEDLLRFRQLKLSTVYTGLESGSVAVLKKLNKHDTPEDAIAASIKLAAAGIKQSVMVLLGAGGREGSADHSHLSAETLNKMQPPLLSFLSMTPVPGTLLKKWVDEGSFHLLSRRENLQEIKMMIERLELKSTVFRCNHSSNAWPLEGRFPRDKERLLEEVNFLLGKLDGPAGDVVETVPSWAL